MLALNYLMKIGICYSKSQQKKMRLKWQPHKPPEKQQNVLEHDKVPSSSYQKRQSSRYI
jgi:hypothetical protein